MKKRIISLLLLAAMLAGTVACSEKADSKPSDEADAVTDSVSYETEPEELDALEQRKLVKDDLPASDFEGRVFRVIHNNDSDEINNFIAHEEETGDNVLDAIYKRNANVCERFNVKEITFDVSRGCDAVARLVNTTVTSGDDAFDLVSSHIVSLSGNATHHVLMNWYNMDYVNFEKPWWSSCCIDDLTYHGTALLAIGDMAMSALSYTYCMYFDKGYAEEYQLGDIYQTVHDGSWTVDLLNTYTRDLYSDINGNGKKDKEDFFGLGFRVGSHTNAFLWAFDNPIIKADGDGELEIVFHTEKLDSILEKLNNLANYNQGGFGIQPYLDAINFFKNGNCVFSLGEIGNAVSYFRDMERDFGIIPYPKWNEEQQRYRTSVNGAHEGMAIPLTVQNTEFVSCIIEALCAETYKNVVPEYYDVALKYKGVRDETSIELLDIIIDGRYFDFGFVYDNFQGASFLLQQLVASKSKSFESTYAKSEKSITRWYNKVITAIDEYNLA